MRNRLPIPDRRQPSWADIITRFWMLGVTLFLVYFVLHQQSVGNERRSQTCTIFERQQAKNIRTLQSTYDYLSGLTAKERRDSLNRTILKQLPQTESEARDSPVPRYCNEPGVGLPEPDPALPKRPPGIG